MTGSGMEGAKQKNQPNYFPRIQMNDIRQTPLLDCEDDPEMDQPPGLDEQPDRVLPGFEYGYCLEQLPDGVRDQRGFNMMINLRLTHATSRLVL